MRALHVGRGWVVAAILEAACGFSHGFPLLVVVFSTAMLWLDAPGRRQAIRVLIAGHLLAFCLLAGWLWPMLEMHGITIPNDASFPLSSWQDLLPVTLRPVFAAGLVALVLCDVPLVRSTISTLQAGALRHFFSSAGLAALGFLAGDQLGLADIRFFPLVWLFHRKRMDGRTGAIRSFQCRFSPSHGVGARAALRGRRAGAAELDCNTR